MNLGRDYTTDDILQAVKRRKWLIAVPFVLCAAAGATVTHRLPNLYRSETLILVVPQRVPESYVRSTVTTRIEDRLRSISDEILSRTRLEAIIRELDLYAVQRQRMPMEDVVVLMRNDIQVDTVKDDSFRVQYVSGDPRLAMEVTTRLASMFINENLHDREKLAEGTNSFLESQLDLARRRLIEHERKLVDYQRQYVGELPSQLQSNLQAIQTSQMQLQSLGDSINRDRDRRLALDRTLADAQAGTPLPPAPGGEPAVDPVEQARTQLNALRAHLKPTHPDVIAQVRRLKELENAPALGPAAPDPAAGSAPVRPSDPTAARVRGIRAEIEKLDAQIASKERDADKLQRTIGDYQRHVDAVPSRESDMIALNRDYETLQKMYQTLLAKKEDSSISANLERQQIGEQFKVLDPARVPERPFSPKRLQLNAIAAGAGLFFGIVLAALQEYRDTSLRTEEQLVSVLKLPVLAIVPVLDSVNQRRRRKLLRWASAGVVLAGVCAAFSVWHLGLLERVL